MNLQSRVFENVKSIPAKYTCTGKNVNPPLHWDTPPAGTKSFALLVDDPDAQSVTGFTWLHWIVKDIPSKTREIRESSVPGTEIRNSSGKQSYSGPCPPNGKHRYYFKLFALDTEKLDAATSAEFSVQIHQHKIGESVLMGTYDLS